MIGTNIIRAFVLGLALALASCGVELTNLRTAASGGLDPQVQTKSQDVATRDQPTGETEQNAGQTDQDPSDQDTKLPLSKLGWDGKTFIGTTKLAVFATE